MTDQVGTADTFEPKLMPSFIQYFLQEIVYSFYITHCIWIQLGTYTNLIQQIQCFGSYGISLTNNCFRKQSQDVCVTVNNQVDLAAVSCRFGVFTIFYRYSSRIKVTMFGDIRLFIKQYTISTYIFANQNRQTVITFLKSTVERPRDFITIPFLDRSILSRVVSR